jgi:DNA-binding transcriptional LysR family regulator
MDTRLLKIFAAVARHGSLPAASRELHVTASALSRGLKALESTLGARLFDRLGKRLVLNQAGEQLLAQIAQPLAALDRAAGLIKALGQWGHGRLRIGAPASACQHLLPKVLRDLHQSFPKLLLVVECGDDAQILEWIRQNQIDVALTIAPDQAPDLEVRPLFEDELLLAFSREHPWADGRSLSRDELARRPLLAGRQSTITADLIDAFWREQQIEPVKFMEIGNTDTMKELVKLSVAAAVLAPWVFEHELASGRIKMKPLGRKALRRRWAVVHRSQTRLALPGEQFIKFCRAAAAGLRLDRRDLPAASIV